MALLDQGQILRTLRSYQDAVDMYGNFSLAMTSLAMLLGGILIASDKGDDAKIIFTIVGSLGLLTAALANANKLKCDELDSYLYQADWGLVNVPDNLLHIECNDLITPLAQLFQTIENLVNTARTGGATAITQIIETINNNNDDDLEQQPALLPRHNH